jgi:hypothetical protein
MKMKKTIQFFLSLLLLTVTGYVHAQVTIGAESYPSKGSLLDLVSSDKGVLFPKVALVAYNDLSPVIINPSSEDEAHSTGMVVYNENDQAYGVVVGLVVWNGQEWQPLSGTIGSMSQISEMECENIIVKGIYTKNQSLSTASNQIIMPVTVHKEGSYNVLVEVYQGDDPSLSNGYTFSASGELHSVGKTLLTLTGQGRPLKATENANLDQLKVYINGREATCVSGDLPGIQVNDITPNYTLNCSSIKMVLSSYKKGYTLTANDYISIHLSSPPEAAGALYKIETNTVNGISFQGSGILAGGALNIILYGSGTIQKSGWFSYTITGNNLLEQICTVDLNIYDDPVKIRIYASGLNSVYQMAGDTRATYLLAHNKELFGLNKNNNALVPVEDVDVSWNYQSNPSNSENYDDYAIVLVGYNSSFSTNAMRNFVDNYVKKGGVAFFSRESAGDLQEIVNYVSGVSNATTAVSRTSMDGALVPLTGNSPAVNGQYADLRGKGISRDGGSNHHFTKYPSDWEVVAGTASAARIIKHTIYDIYVCGDGGTLAGGLTTSTYPNPACVDTDGNPQTSSTKGGSNLYNEGGYNSFFLANLMLYAVQKQINK